MSNGCQIIGALIGSVRRIKERSKKGSGLWSCQRLGVEITWLIVILLWASSSFRPLYTRLKLSGQVEMTMTPKSR